MSENIKPELKTVIARVQAARLMNFYHMSRDQAMALAKKNLLRFWGLTAQRGWARLILGRCQVLVVAPAEPGTTARGPGEAASDHFNHVTPGHGRDTAKATGFGWRGSTVA